jgi:hypothetical protein
MCRMGHGISLRGSRGHRDAVRAREGYPEAPAAAPTGTRRLPIAIGMGCRVYCGPNHFANTSTPDVLAMWRDAVTAPARPISTKAPIGGIASKSQHHVMLT